MKFNSVDVKELSMSPGDQEGRLIHKTPPKTLHDSGYKEKWFKLKGNFLFYYHLTEDGAVERNEPNGVFVLENVLVETETKDTMFKNGFTLSWKDDPYRKHGFFSRAENVLQIWIGKIVRASYENLRAQLLVLRLQIRQKSGKDPLESMGVSFPSCSMRSSCLLKPQKKALNRSSSNSQLLDLYQESNSLFVSNNHFSAPSSPSGQHRQKSIMMEQTAQKTNNLNLQPPLVPIPPPRLNRDRRRHLENSNEKLTGVCPKDSSFKSHVTSSSSKETRTSSFKSHLREGISQEELDLFLK